MNLDIDLDTMYDLIDEDGGLLDEVALDGDSMQPRDYFLGGGNTLDLLFDAGLTD